MPTFVMTGPYVYNLTGNTSKGYFISRSGKNVTIKFGVIIYKRRRYYSTGPNLPQVPKKLPKFKSQEEAILFYKNRIKEKLKKGYKKLRSDSRILSFRKLKSLK